MRGWGLAASVYRVSSSEVIKNVLELDGGCGCTTL